MAEKQFNPTLAIVTGASLLASMIGLSVMAYLLRHQGPANPAPGSDVVGIEDVYNIADAYRVNRVAADASFKDRVIEVPRQMARVSSLRASGKSYAMYEMFPGPPHVEMILTPKSAAVLRTFDGSERVRLRGTCIGEKYGFVTIKDCEILSAEKIIDKKMTPIPIN